MNGIWRTLSEERKGNIIGAPIAIIMALPLALGVKYDIVPLFFLGVGIVVGSMLVILIFLLTDKDLRKGIFK